MKKRNRIKISDIAKAAGVSSSTVSYVLSGKRTISDETKKKVLEQVELLGYKPNAAARSFGTNKTYTIGFYVKKETLGHNNDLFFLANILGITSVLGPNQYKLLLLDEIEDTDEEYSIPINKTFAIDGAIVSNTRNLKQYLSEFEKESMPFVLMGKPPVGIDAYYVDNDNQSAAYSGVEYLFQRGCSRIALVTNADTTRTFGMDYLSGYMMAYTAYQKEIDFELVIRIDRNNKNCIDRFKKELQEKKVDGIITVSENPAIRNYCYYQENIASPIPVIIFGFDLYQEFYPDKEHCHISYIDSNAFRLGAECAKKLLGLIEEETQEKSSLFPQEIKQW